MPVGIGYLQCLYCIPYKSEPGKKAPKSVGKYRVKRIGDTILLFECQKCNKTFKSRIIGMPLRWEDMADVEKRCVE